MSMSFPGETQDNRVAMSQGVVKLVMSQGDNRAMSWGDVKLAMSGRSKFVMSRCVETVSPNLHLNSTGSKKFPEAVRLGVVNSLVPASR